MSTPSEDAKMLSEEKKEEVTDEHKTLELGHDPEIVEFLAARNAVPAPTATTIFAVATDVPIGHGAPRCYVATILTRHGEYLDKSPTSVLMTPDAWAMVDRWTLPRRCNLSSLVMMVREGALTDEERKTHKIVTMVSGWALSHAVDTPPEIVATSNWKLSMTIDEARDFLNLLVAPFGNAGVVVNTLNLRASDGTQMQIYPLRPSPALLAKHSLLHILCQ